MLTRRNFATVLAAPALASGAKSAPNVLFIASDDLNTSLGCYGHPLVKSPNIDRLAARGVRFDRAYCNFPLCGPSRTSLLSGRRPDSTGIVDNSIAVRERLIPDVVTLPQMFRQAGRHSVRIGKMYHMDVPAGVGKNLFDDPPSWDEADSPPGREHNIEGERRNVTPKAGSGNNFEWVSFTGDGRHQADRVGADRAIEYIHQRGQKPFFMGLGFVRPHVPLVAPARFFDLYPLSQIQPVTNPPGDRDDIPKASEIVINTRANDMGMNDADKREALRGYYASISYMDSLVGEVLDALNRSKQAERTVIVFWSDHGWHLGEHHRWQKRSLFEESSRVPLIVSAPGMPRGKASRGLVELVDLYPTLAELGGIVPPAGFEGQSFVPLLQRPERPWKTAVFTQMNSPKEGIVGRAVRTATHRYIRWEGPYPDEELYDLERDPREFTNLARLPEHDGLKAKLRATLAAGWSAARAKV
ncbi:MAG: sulfatase [Bryobacteraceae bacterium]|nr:sulfatase [Bryobacteraceae bacterium]